MEASVCEDPPQVAPSSDRRIQNNAAYRIRAHKGESAPMTNAIVWKLPKHREIWAVADSRVSHKRKDGDATRVTDQAVKILPIEATVHRRSSHAEQPEAFSTLRLGLCYAGAVLPALMTHAAANFFLSNLVAESGGFPNRENLAELIRSLSEQYTRDASFAYAIDNPPVCEFAVFGQSPASNGSSEFWAYWIHPGQGAANGFKQVKESVDLEAGEMVVLGEQTSQLKNDIGALQALGNPAWDGAEPRIALSNRIRKNAHDTVGGTLQGAILKDNSIERFGSLYSEPGSFFQNWLGFDYQKEIADILGMDVAIRALLG